MPRERKRAINLSIPSATWAEIRAEAVRTDRSPAWILRQAWRLAAVRMRALPAADAPAPENE